MAKENLVPILVRIGLRYNEKAKRNEHDYPPFNQLDPAVRDRMDWSVFFDIHGISWHYDKIAGHAHHDAYKQSKGVGVGTWLGATCVPEAFAEAALAAFPDRVSEMSEEEFEEFYDSRAHAREPELHIDKEIVEQIEMEERLAKQGLGQGKLHKTDAASVAKRNAALDPDDPTPGIRRNMNKTWQTFKASIGCTIRPKNRKPQ